MFEGAQFVQELMKMHCNLKCFKRGTNGGLQINLQKKVAALSARHNDTICKHCSRTYLINQVHTASERAANTITCVILHCETLSNKNMPRAVNGQTLLNKSISFRIIAIWHKFQH